MIDIHSETWRHVTEHCRKRREVLLEQFLVIDSPVENLRGQIAMLDEILKLGRDDPPPPITPTSYD